MQLIEELRWRGLIHDMIPGTEEFLANNKATGYVGFDPTAPSLGIGNLVPLMLLVHFQRHGHSPVALVGGATGRIGDPSGKLAERTLLSEEVLDYNVEKIRDQLSRFLDFEATENPALLVNNYDWFKDFGFLDFMRDVGKHLTVNYMISKDSVRSRMESGTGISFTEFSYQLIQGYDFYHLYKNHGCSMQFGGSDQWGNITAGTELIRKMMGPDEEVFAFTAPLITRSDGRKFGKSEQGNIYIDPEMTSAFRFYQFWRQLNDSDVVKLTKIFSLKPIEELETLIAAHEERPGSLQKVIAEEMTLRIHGEDALKRAISASNLLFGRGGLDDLRSLSFAEVQELFHGVPQSEIGLNELGEGINIVDFLAQVEAASSKGDARRKVTKDKCISINTVKVTDDQHALTSGDIVNDRFILVNIGKKKRHIVYIN